MTRSNSFLVTASLIVLVAWAGTLGCADGDHIRSSRPASTSLATENGPIRLLDLAGNPFDLWQSNPTHVTVVVFTLSDCPVSNRYAPVVRELYESFHPRGVDFYLIYVDPREQPNTIRDHLQEYQYPCPGLRDPEHTLVAYTGATVTPEAVVFRGDRRITYRGRIDDLFVELGKSQSAPTKNDLADAIAATLEGRPVVEPVTKAVGCYIANLK